MMYLCCDLGSETADWGVYDPSQREFIFRRELATPAYEDFYEMLDDFLIKYRRQLGESPGKIINTTFAIGGPTNHKVVRPTNIEGWQIKTETTNSILEDHGHEPYSSIINDFEALGYGILYLFDKGFSPDDVIPVYGKFRTGPPRVGEEIGPRSMICGSGAGLGLSCVVQGVLRDGYPYILTSEGGHHSIAPETPEQYRLLGEDGTFRGGISYEWALSRDGLRNLYNFFRREDYNAEPNYGISEDMILAIATSGKDQAATDAIELFCELLANFCGNSVLTFNCDRAVFLWGSILRELPLELIKGRFKRYYTDRFMHGDEVAQVPVVLLQNKDIPMLGCVHRSRYEIEFQVK